MAGSPLRYDMQGDHGFPLYKVDIKDFEKLEKINCLVKEFRRAQSAWCIAKSVRALGWLLFLVRIDPQITPVKYTSLVIGMNFTGQAQITRIFWIYFCFLSFRKKERNSNPPEAEQKSGSSMICSSCHNELLVL